MKNLPEISPIIEEKLRFMQLYLHDIKFFRAGNRSVLRVFIDKPGGVTISDCEQASNAISTILDVENFSSRPYTLEVSSPGADRQLRSGKDYKMVIGHYLRLIMKNETETRMNKEYIGKLISCENGTVTVEMDNEQTIDIQLADIEKAKIDVRFK